MALVIALLVGLRTLASLAITAAMFGCVLAFVVTVAALSSPAHWGA